ncbi:MAG: AraC family transcriptional regulator [Kofleriaceae bacterium]
MASGVQIRVADGTILPSVCAMAEGLSLMHLSSATGLVRRVTKSSTEPALLVSVAMRAIAPSKFQLWCDDAPLARVGATPLRTIVMDFAARPTVWAGSAFEYVHVHVPRADLDAIAEDAGFTRVFDYRQTLDEDDRVVAELVQAIVPAIGRSDFALEEFGVALGTHVVEKYGDARRRTRLRGERLAAWRQRRVIEVARARLSDVTLAELAAECGLSTSHFARQFKATFGTSPHRMLIAQRIERAKQLLSTAMTLSEVASVAGFADQASFTRSFTKAVGTSPGKWRRLG